MPKNTRRDTGGPHYGLDQVRFAAQHQFHITRRALIEDAPRVLPARITDRVGAIRDIVRSLQEIEWRFSEEDEKGWVDVYRVSRFGREYWVKIKMELLKQAKEYVIVISFHEWDV